MGCCCNQRVAGCRRQSYLEVDGVGANLIRLDAGWEGDFYGNFHFGNAHVAALSNVDKSDDSGLFEGVLGASYYGTDWVWLQFNRSDRGAPLSNFDNLIWTIERNGSNEGFSNRSWSFRGIYFGPEFDWNPFSVGRNNFFYVVRFQWTFGAVSHTADVYLPEYPLRDWNQFGGGLSGAYVMHNGIKYTMDNHLDPVTETVPSGAQNSLLISTTPLQVDMSVRWAYPDSLTTTTDGATTTTHDIDYFVIDFLYRPSGLRDFLLQDNKGQTVGLVPVVGSFAYKTDCGEAQPYSVSPHSSVFVKHSICTDASLEVLEPLGQGFGRGGIRHVPYNSPQNTDCVGDDSTTTSADACYVWNSPTNCSLPCIDGVDEPVWVTPVNCLYEVSAHDRTWSLFTSGDSDPLTPKPRLSNIARSFFRFFRIDRSPIATLDVVNRIVGSTTSPWLILKLGVSVKYEFAFLGKDYYDFWLAAYGYDLSSAKSIDLIRDADLSMSRIWQYGEDVAYCNDLGLLDRRESQKHHYHQAGSFAAGVSGFYRDHLQMFHPYGSTSSYTPNKPAHPKFFIDIGAWLLANTTTTSGGDLYAPNTYSGQFTRYSSVPDQYSCIATDRGWYVTDPEYVTRPHCTLADDGLTPTQLYSAGYGNVPVTFTEYWVDMPSTVLLEAI